MQRRVRIIMDRKREIKPDCKTNWIGSTEDSEFSMKKAIEYNRDTLVLRDYN